MRRLYNYVGPKSIAEAVRNQPGGVRIASSENLCDWLDDNAAQTISGRKVPQSSRTWVATYTINPDGFLYLAPRRSEHVACAKGGPVLSAGELRIDAQRVVIEVSNQSTGFCPEPESWPAVDDALDRACIQHPSSFTTEVIFRRCPSCENRNLVKDGWFYCGVCDHALPEQWNFA